MWMARTVGKVRYIVMIGFVRCSRCGLIIGGCGLIHMRFRDMIRVLLATFLFFLEMADEPMCEI